MRDISSELAAHLNSGATTLCRCWKLTRRDDIVKGFTDHDVMLSFDDVDFEPAAGFTASELPSSLGLNVDTSEITGALVSPHLDEDDLHAGIYDGAMIEQWLVNWADVSQRLLLEKGTLGEITRQGQNFTAEVRSLSAKLDQERGRLFQVTCDADLGDTRCGVDLEAEGNSATGEVVSVSGARTFMATGLNTIAASRLERGRVTFTSGSNSGHSFFVRLDKQDEDGRVLELWRQPAQTMSEGDTFVATIGCDKTFGTCSAVFNNAVNFRGFPHIPGSDFALSYVTRDTGDHDGGALLP
ncbi:MAG: DUF2163 domain-containing protein [Pseudomonadota bacterium]